MGELDKYIDITEKADTIKYVGRIVRVNGLLIEAKGPHAVVGEVCRIETASGNVLAEVVGLNREIVQLMPYAETSGLEVGNRVVASGSRLEVPVSNELLGKLLDFQGKLWGGGEIDSNESYLAQGPAPDPDTRPRIKEHIVTGVRAIDSLLTVGKGQRIGIFAGSGVGKSTLIGMIARNTNADVNVVALIGERGREVNDFIEKDLGPEGFKHSVVVATPSNAPPLARIRGAYTATAIAEYFRDQGKDVMLLFDSVTRFALAQREIGLAIGEPPATRGYTPSVFDNLPKLLERSGTSPKGSITAFYAVLVEGDDTDEPISDTVRGILDGHFILSRNLAKANHYPAIDVLPSISRLMPEVTGRQTRKAAGEMRRLISVYSDAEDIINIGAYQDGSNPDIDLAKRKHKDIEEFLKQEIEEKASYYTTMKKMASISGIDIPDEEITNTEVNISETVSV
ncbi:MAG: FliI/YscN family ATPase [Spirochaetaceae bacterium]|jgi:flagellum-specific ATP synthase|nr:FliI/YscN family ATPase [Spirochaetaceae bacterium]